MTKLFAIWIYLAFSLFPMRQTSEWDMEETVYISTSKNAYAYHIKKECRTIRECLMSGHVKSCSRQDAINRGRQTCGVCLKKEHNEWKLMGKITP